MIITIDGPAGAGKSSVARRLARRLGFRFLDTGAMYRAVTLAAMRAGVDWQNTSAIAELAKNASITLEDDRIFLGQEDVSVEIRSVEVTAQTRHVANNPQARHHLIDLQRKLAAGKNVVTEGRDQGSLAFPHADCKFFLTASPEERAQRRVAERQARGENVTLQEVLDEQTRRDAEDEAREVGRLVPADDAILVNTDQLDLDQVVAKLVELFHDRCGPAGADATP